MRVVEMLTHKGNSSLGLIWIELGHVHIIDEVNEFRLARRSETSTTHLDELGLKNLLEQSGVCEEVEVDDLLAVVLASSGQLIKETLDNLGLTATGITNKHGGDTDCDELLHNVLRGNCVIGRHRVAGNSL